MRSLLYVKSLVNDVFLQIDVECSGMIEILCYLSILWFYDIYDIMQKCLYSIIGFIYIVFANVFRIFIICLLVHLYGFQIYDFAHAYLGRIIFYILSVLLYFYVFTKPQIEKMKVGDFKYDK